MRRETCGTSEMPKRTCEAREDHAKQPQGKPGCRKRKSEEPDTRRRTRVEDVVANRANTTAKTRKMRLETCETSEAEVLAYQVSSRTRFIITFLSPAVILYSLFVALPLLQSFQISFYHW